MRVRYVKAEGERKRYQIDYTDWLDVGEAVTAVVFTIQNNTALKALVIDGIMVLPTGFGVQYYISGGADGITYNVLAALTTTIGPQVREDEVVVTIREP